MHRNASSMHNSPIETILRSSTFWSFEMKVRFLGPVGKVTGSCSWMWDEERRWNFLIDCGMQQGEPTARDWNEGRWPFDPGTIQFVVLTHAHVDHCGLLPLLYKQGFNGLVYCTRETAALAALLLKDAAKLSDLGYSPDDVDQIRWHEPGAGRQVLGHFHPVSEDLFLRFYRSGHIAGAVSVAVHWGPPGTPDQRSIIFSGDLGPNVEDVETLPFLRHRMGVPRHNFAVVESTYGGRIREVESASPENRRARLAALLDRTLETQGTLVIPAFALGRTQDILFDIHWLWAESPQKYARVPVFLDSPSARKINCIAMKALERTETNGRKAKVRPLWLGKQMFRWFGLNPDCTEDVNRLLQICALTLGQASSTASEHPQRGSVLARSWGSVVRPPMPRESVSAELEAGPAVLIVSSGTCDGGPAAYWLPKLLADDRNAVALAGFCSPATVGGRLLNISNLPELERTRLSGELRWAESSMFPEADVRASITQLEGYSAHADQTGLLGWLFGRFDGENVPAGELTFIQHGNDHARKELAKAIEERSVQLTLPMRTSLPSEDDIFDLELEGQAFDAEAELRLAEQELAHQIAHVAALRKRRLP